MARVDYDVIVAGGGVAGISAAAALREFGWSVLIVEPGQHADRRLAGELIHPRGVAALTELGLYGSGSFRGAIPIRGFVAFTGLEDDRSQIALPYAEDSSLQRGFALDHADIRLSLQLSAKSLPYVRTLVESRVVGVEDHGPVTIVAIAEAGTITRLTCRLVISADGASSAVRGFAGISHFRRPISKITGYVITDRNIPAPGFGHVFMGSLAPLLVYEIGAGFARVLFDQPINQCEFTPADHRARVTASIAHFQLREEIIDAVASQRGLGFISADLVVDRATHGSVALLGDAGGSCHPLTATGMTSGAADAIRLRDAFRDSKGDIPAGLKLYGTRRKAPQRTRLLVASALHEACSGRTPESRLVRKGLIRYWTHGARGRTASMAILAMSDIRFVSALREMLLVILHGFASPLQLSSTARVSTAARLVRGLASTVMRQMTFALRAR
jgi:squalene monooxygenase